MSASTSNTPSNYSHTDDMIGDDDAATHTNTNIPLSSNDGNETVSPFIRKTFQMVSDDITNDTCTWDESGKSFIVRNELLFSSTVLPKYFRHKNFSSFVRQLNFYGFHKRSVTTKSQYIKFNHPYFQQNRIDLLIYIKRKPTEQTNNFKISLDLLEQKYDVLQKSYDDLQYTLKNMLFIFARYMAQHQHQQSISPHELQQKLQDLQGRVSMSNTMMPSIDTNVLHKRPRLMLESGSSERNSTALTQQYNNNSIDDSELYQQILSLTERLSNMPNGVPHQQNNNNTTQHRQYNDTKDQHDQTQYSDEYDDNIQYDDSTEYNPNDVNYNESNITDNANNQQSGNTQYHPYQQKKNLAMPSQIELIEDDELSPKLHTSNALFKSNNNISRGVNSSTTGTRKPQQRSTRVKSPIKVEVASGSSAGSTPLTSNTDYNDIPIFDEFPSNIPPFTPPANHTFNTTHTNNNNNNITNNNSSIFDTSGLSPLHPMLSDPSYLDPSITQRQDSTNMFDEYNLPVINSSPISTPLHYSSALSYQSNTPTASPPQPRQSSSSTVLNQN